MLTFSLTGVRHGETQFNKEKLLQGQAVDTSLSEPGLQQVEAAGLYLSESSGSPMCLSVTCSAPDRLQKSLRNNVHSSGVELVFDPVTQREGKAAMQEVSKVPLPGMVDDHGCSGQSSTAVGRGAGATESGTDGPLPGLPDNGMEGVPLHALVVSHGAYIRVAVRHFVEDLQCSLPQGLKMSTVLSACPNTGISRFVLIVSPTESGLALSAVRCVFTNRKDHLTSRNICYITH